LASLNPYESPRTERVVRLPIETPEGVAGVLRTGVLLYVGNFQAIALLTLIVWGPVELFVSYLEYEAPDPERVQIYVMVIEQVLAIIPMAGLMAIGAAAMRGEAATWWQGLQEGLAAWPRMLGTRLIVAVFVLLGSMLCVVPGLYVAVRSILAETAAVIEGRSGMSAPQRSFELTKGKSWHFLAILLAAYGFIYAVAFGLWLPLEAFPEINTWLVAALTYVVRDLLSGLSIQILVAAYWASAHPRQVHDQLALD
jgi:hypothetical protein